MLFPAGVCVFPVSEAEKQEKLIFFQGVALNDTLVDI